MAAVPLILMAAGTAVDVGANIKAGQDEGDALQAEAANRRREADEVEARARINERAILRQGRAFLGDQTNAFAGAGVDASGSTLDVLEQTASEIRMDVELNRRDAAFRADQLRRGAISADKAAGNARTAGLLRAGSSLATGASKIGEYASRSKKPSPSPDTSQLGDYSYERYLDHA
jgi:hypothetical protein